MKLTLRFEFIKRGNRRGLRCSTKNIRDSLKMAGIVPQLIPGTSMIMYVEKTFDVHDRQAAEEWRQLVENRLRYAPDEGRWYGHQFKVTYHD